MHLERLAVIALTLADLARDVDIRQEVHLDLQQAVAGAGLAAAAANVEREAPGIVAAQLRVLRGGKEAADIVKQAGIRRRVGARRAADGTLVNVDDLVQILHTVNAVAFPGAELRMVEPARKGLVQHLVDERGLAAAGHAGHARHDAERDLHIHVLEVVLARTADHKRVAVSGAALRGHGDLHFAGQILPGDGALTARDLLRRTGADHFPAVHARTRADVDEVIRRTHGVLVMLDDDERIAEVAQLAQRGQQLFIVALVQADGRLVEDIQHTHERRADLRSEPDALALAAGERCRRARKRQILQADTLQKMQPRAHLAQNTVGDLCILLAEREPVEKRQLLRDWQRSEFRDVQPADRDGQHLRPQTRAVTVRAGRLRHTVLKRCPHGIALRLLIAALKVADDALKRAAQHAGTAVGIIMQSELFIPRAVEQDLAHVLRQVADGRCKVKVIFFRQRVVIHPADALILDAVPAARGDAAVEDRLQWVRNDERRVDAQPRAEAAAGRARTVGAVEREHPRRELLDRDAAVIAGVVLREEDLALFLRDIRQHKAAGERRRDLDGVGQAAVLVGADDNTVDHDLNIVLAVFIERDRLREVVDAAVHAHAHIPAAAGIVEHLLVLAFACTDDRRKDLHARRLRQRRDLIDDLVDRLAADLLAALRAVRHADTCPQQTQIVVDLRDRADGRTRIFAGGLLVDGDGRTHAVDGVDVGLVHLAEKLPRIRRQTLHIAPLPLGKDGVERKTRLAGAGQAGHDDQCIARNFHINILEIVLPRAFDYNMIPHGCLRNCLGFNSQLRRARTHERDDRLRRDLDLIADLAGADEDGLLRERLRGKDRAKLLFHADRRAAAAHIARERRELGHVQHGNGLLPHGLGRLLEVKLARDRDDEHVRRLARAAGDQRLEHLRRVHARHLGDGHAVHRIVAVRICVRRVGHLLLVEQTHDICFFDG